MPKKAPLVTFFLYLHLPCRLESFFPLSHHCLHSIRHYAISIQSLQTQINFIITISIHLSTRISIGFPLSCWNKSYPYPSLLLNLYWTLGRVYHSHPLLLTAQLGHPPIGRHHPHLTFYNTVCVIKSLAVLRGLRNQISSSAHSGVVWGHVEFRALGSSTSGDEKSVRLKSY